MTPIQFCMERVQGGDEHPPAAAPEPASRPDRRRMNLPYRETPIAPIAKTDEQPRRPTPEPAVPPESSLTPAIPDPHAHYGLCVKTVTIPPPVPEFDLVPSPEPPSTAAGNGRLLNGQLPRFMAMVRAAMPSAEEMRVSAENHQMAEVEARREGDLLRAAVNQRNPQGPMQWSSAVWNEGARAAERRRKIARCEAEIRALDAQPHDIPDKAWLVALGRRDWEAEKALLEQGAC